MIGTMWGIAGFILASPWTLPPKQKKWTEDFQFIPVPFYRVQAPKNGQPLVERGVRPSSKNTLAIALIPELAL